MTFLNPMILWALALPLLLAVAAIALHRRANMGWRRLIAAGHRRELVTPAPAWRRTLPLVLALLALTAGIVATARPINGYKDGSSVATGRNLLIALDISRSMETQDVRPSRLEEARAAAYELIDALPGDKIGLIVFSGEADLVVPLTYDHTALRETLEHVDRDWAGYGGTNFGLVLRKAMQDFTRSAPTGTNALVIFSDGEDTVGSSLDIAREAKENHLLVITVGVGTPAGDSIPDEAAENGLYKDSRGKHVISKLDTAALKRFADATGGDFFTMGGGADITSFAREAVQKLDRHEETVSNNKVPIDLFAPFAIAALVLLVLAIVLATEWRVPRRAAMLLLFCLLAAPLSAAPAEESVQAYSEGLAQAGKDAAKAREAFSRALLDEDAALQAACLYQIGKVSTEASFGKLRALYEPAPQAEAGEEDELAGAPAPQAPAQPTVEQLEEVVAELEQSQKSFRDALGLQPGMEAAQKNIAKVDALIRKLKEEIERLKQQQQQDQQQQNQQQQQQDQDDQQKQQNQSRQQQQQGNSKNQKPGDSDQQQDQKDQQPQDKQEGKQDKDKKDGKQQGGNQAKKDENQQKKDQQDKAEDGKSKNKDKSENQKDGSEGEQDKEKEQDKEGRQKDKPQDKPSRSDKKSQPQQQGSSDEEKKKQRAASILKMHREEEGGSPIPHVADELRPPEKDY